MGSAGDEDDDDAGINANDGVILATGGYDHTIRLWQAHSGLNHKTFQHTDSVSFTLLYPIIFAKFLKNGQIFKKKRFLSD